MRKGGRERTRCFLLSAGVPDPTPGLGAQANQSAQCGDALVDTTYATHPRFLAKASSKWDPHLCSSPRGQPGEWRSG